MNDKRYYCPAGSSSCYYYNTTTAVYSTQWLACQSQSGYLVAYNTAEEQVGEGAAGGVRGWGGGQRPSRSLRAGCNSCHSFCTHNNRRTLDPAQAFWLQAILSKCSLLC
jgi:hypothetical protein